MIRSLVVLSLAALLWGCEKQGAVERAEPVKTEASAAPAVALPSNFTALGTEPFWSARVDGEQLTYSTPENPSGELIAVTRRPTAAGTEISGTLAGAPLRLAISPGPCSDGMSDAVYSHSAELRIATLILQGCAKPR